MIKKRGTFSSSLVFSIAGSDPAPAAALQSVGKGAERRRAGEQVSLFVFKHGNVCKFSSLRHLWFNIFLFPHFFLFPSHFLLHLLISPLLLLLPLSMLLFSSHPFFFLFFFSLLSSPRISHLLASSLLSLPSCFPSTFISSSSPSFLLIFHVFPLHYTLSSTLPSPLKFVSVLPLVTSSSLCPPQHGSRCVEQSWRGVAGSGKHRRRHWVFSHRLGAGSQQPHPALHHHSQSAMRKKTHRACLHDTSQTHTRTDLWKGVLPNPHTHINSECI